MVKTCSFNLRIYETAIKSFLPDISQDDLAYVANQAARIYKWADKTGGCVDNFRVKQDGVENCAYGAAYNKGCCGEVDQAVTNPLTGNTYIICFNYGH